MNARIYGQGAHPPDPITGGADARRSIGLPDDTPLLFRIIAGFTFRIFIRSNDIAQNNALWLFVQVLYRFAYAGR